MYILVLCIITINIHNIRLTSCVHQYSVRRDIIENRAVIIENYRHNYSEASTKPLRSNCYGLFVAV